MATVNTEGTVYFSAYLTETGEISYGSIAFSAEGKVVHYNLYVTSDLLYVSCPWLPINFPQGLHAVRWEDNREYKIEYTNDHITAVVRRKRRK